MYIEVAFGELRSRLVRDDIVFTVNCKKLQFSEHLLVF